MVSVFEMSKSEFLSPIVGLLFVHDIIGKNKIKMIEGAILETASFECMRKNNDDRA